MARVEPASLPELRRNFFQEVKTDPDNLPGRTGQQAPSAGGVQNLADATATAAGTSGGICAESASPARDVSFCCRYWDYLRRITPDEPNAADFHLEERYAETLRRQCTIEFNNQVVARARAAAITKGQS